MVLLIVAIATSLAAYMAMQQVWWQRQGGEPVERAQSASAGGCGYRLARAVLAGGRGNSVDHEKKYGLAPSCDPVEGGR